MGNEMCKREIGKENVCMFVFVYLWCYGVSEY